MKGWFKVKFVPTRTKGFRGQRGDAGNRDRQPWELIADMIDKEGIEKVERIRHDETNPTNKHELDGKEMLALWKAVSKRSAERLRDQKPNAI